MNRVVDTTEIISSVYRAVDKARSVCDKSQMNAIYIALLRHMPWHVINNHIRARQRNGIVEAWAIVWPNGKVLVDTTFDSEAMAWQVALGWPDDEEIAHAKSNGVKAMRVRIDTN